MASLRTNLNAADHIREELARRLLACAITLQSEHMADLNRSNPPPFRNPARPGEFPKKRTGNLQGSVDVEPADLEAVKRTLKVRVGYRPNGFYGVALARRGFLSLLDTLARVRSRLVTALGHGGNVQGVGG